MMRLRRHISMAFNKRKPGRTAKVVPREVMAIREDYATGRFSQPELARKYGIGPAQIGKIVRGEAWMDITHGNEVVTEQGIQMREYAATNYIEREAQRSLERLRAIAPEVFAASTTPLSPPSSSEAAVAADERMLAYQRMMAGAEQQADNKDGTTVRREQVVEQLHEMLNVPKGKIALINAEKLLEELKDENQSQNS